MGLKFVFLKKWVCGLCFCLFLFLFFGENVGELQFFGTVEGPGIITGFVWEVVCFGGKGGRREKRERRKGVVCQCFSFVGRKTRIFWWRGGRSGEEELSVNWSVLGFGCLFRCFFGGTKKGRERCLLAEMFFSTSNVGVGSGTGAFGYSFHNKNFFI